MKLFYYQAPKGNIGDDLNKWIWPKLLGNCLDDDPSHLIIGIGTLLNSKLPKAEKYTVLTSGVGYHEKMVFDPKAFNVVALRGHLSQKELGIRKKNICLLDGAYLLPSLLNPKRTPTDKIGYIPHVDSITNGRWEDVCKLTGIVLIDPRWGVEKFISALTSCSKVITEAMHGAILADAYRIPWQPAKAYNYINLFKWDDWASSLSLEFKFTHLEPTWVGDHNLPIKRKAINSVKRVMLKSGFFLKQWDLVLPTRTKDEIIDKNAELLSFNARFSPYYISKSNLVSKRTNQLLEIVLDFNSNRF